MPMQIPAHNARIVVNQNHTYYTIPISASHWIVSPTALAPPTMNLLASLDATRMEPYQSKTDCAATETPRVRVPADATPGAMNSVPAVLAPVVVSHKANWMAEAVVFPTWTCVIL